MKSFDTIHSPSVVVLYLVIFVFRISNAVFPYWSKLSSLRKHLNGKSFNSEHDVRNKIDLFF